jgi:hypothetical protein
MCQVRMCESSCGRLQSSGVTSPPAEPEDSDEPLATAKAKNWFLAIVEAILDFF